MTTHSSLSFLCLLCVEDTVTRMAKFLFVYKRWSCSGCLIAISWLARCYCVWGFEQDPGTGYVD